MKNNGKRIVRSLMSVLLILALFASINFASAKSCKHDYGDTDVCKKCGALRIHKFDQPITFYTIKDGVQIRNKPTKNSTCVNKVAHKDSAIEIDGIIRNQYGNIWLKVANKQSYAFLGNMYLDFGTLVVQNYQQITAWKGDKQRLAAFSDLVRPGGAADYKQWLDPGNKKISYTVRFNGNDDYDMTAEELGNVHYGFLARAIGLNSELILYGGGAVNLLGHLNWNNVQPHMIESSIKCVGLTITPLYPICVLNQTTAGVLEDIYYECSSSYCDEYNDSVNVGKGIDYYDTGVFSW